MTLEHTLRTELRSLREEMEDTSFSKSISSARLDSLQAEVYTKLVIQSIIRPINWPINIILTLSTLIYSRIIRKYTMLIHCFCLLLITTDPVS